jgi:hypothetical protein
MTPLRLKWILTLMIFSFTFALPVINIFILYKLGRISSLTLKEQEERTFPYILTSCFYFGLFYLFIDLNIWSSIKVLIFGGGLAILLTALINRKFKISAHMVGAGGLLGSLMVVSFFLKFDSVPEIAMLFLLCGVIATARLYLKAHAPVQIYAGFFLGMMVQILVFFISVYINFT